MKRGARLARQSGFTRIEAVAVVGVAGALGALVLPASAQGSILDLIFGRSERTSSCQSNLKQISLGILQYQQDYDEVSPPATTTSEYFGWAQLVQPYVKSTKLFQCPAEKHVLDEGEAAARDGFKKAGFTDYWLNSRVSRRSLAAFATPAQTISLGDGDGGSALSNARYNIAALPQVWRDTPRSPSRRHVRSGVEGANYAFADGHVKWYTPDKISTASQSRNPSSAAASTPTFAIE